MDDRAYVKADEAAAPVRAEATPVQPAAEAKPAVAEDAAPLDDAVPAALPARATQPRRSRKRPLLFAALPVALVAGAYFYVTGGAVISSDNAYIRAAMVGVSTDVSGIVKEVDVKDNQQVAEGDVLFRLDDQPFQLALTRATAQLATVRNDIAALKASYRDMQAQIDEQQVEVAYFQTEFARQQQLVSRNFASKAAFDQAQRSLDGARQKLGSLQAQLAGIAANLAGNPDIRPEDHPRFVDALAQRDEAARQLSHTVVRAPLAGIVTNVPSLQPGQYLTASTASMSVVSGDHVWVEANPKETELTNVRPGQKVTVTVDSYPGETWSGTVDSISPASGSSFSLLPAQNTSGNWVKVVQRIPMRIRIETPPDMPVLRSGMSVEAEIDTGHARGLPQFVSNLFTTAKAKPVGKNETAGKD
jgi:membrane fusion protein (multidrug efflux system)